MEKLIEMVRGFSVLYDLYDTSHEDYMRSKLKGEDSQRIKYISNTIR